MMATKDQECKALAEIMKIVDGLAKGNAKGWKIPTGYPSCSEKGEPEMEIARIIPAKQEVLRALKCTKNENAHCRSCPYMVPLEGGGLDYCDQDRLELDAARIIEIQP